jgi:chaperone required for assembly of F1-ATPase
MPHPQPEATTARLAEAVAALDPFRLAGLSPVVTISGSLVGALALIEDVATPEAIWQAAYVDEDWQAEQWGEDALAVEAREARRVEFDAGVRFLGLVQADQSPLDARVESCAHRGESSAWSVSALPPIAAVLCGPCASQ